MSYGASGAMQFNGFTGTMIPTMTRIQNKGIVYQPKTWRNILWHRTFASKPAAGCAGVVTTRCQSSVPMLKWHKLGLLAGYDCGALRGKKVSKYGPKDDPKSIFVH